MEAFEPLINALVLLSALSIAAERLANVVKLRSPELRDPLRKLSQRDEKERERQIANRVLGVSILLALAVKADFFAMLSHLQAPWDTLGWTRNPVTSGWSLASAVAGSILTGVSLGFGSKFWHDVLDIVYRARRMERET